MAQIAFSLVSPEKLLLSEDVDMVVVPGAEGDFGVLAGHIPLISTIRPGVIAIHQGGVVTKRLFVAGGFAEVTPERCTVLADQAEAVESINTSATEQQIKNLTEDYAAAKTEAEKQAIASLMVIAKARLSAATATLVV